MSTCDKPLAVEGLHSFRYRGRYAWVMIGAKDNADAMREAGRSISDTPTIENLQYWDGKGYISCTRLDS